MKHLVFNIYIYIYYVDNQQFIIKEPKLDKALNKPRQEKSINRKISINRYNQEREDKTPNNYIGIVISETNSPLFSSTKYKNMKVKSHKRMPKISNIFNQVANKSPKIISSEQNRSIETQTEEKLKKAKSRNASEKKNGRTEGSLNKKLGIHGLPTTNLIRKLYRQNLKRNNNNSSLPDLKVNLKEYKLKNQANYSRRGSILILEKEDKKFSIRNSTICFKHDNQKSLSKVQSQPTSLLNIQQKLQSPTFPGSRRESNDNSQEIIPRKSVNELLFASIDQILPKGPLKKILSKSNKQNKQLTYKSDKKHRRIVSESNNNKIEEKGGKGDRLKNKILNQESGILSNSIKINSNQREKTSCEREPVRNRDVTSRKKESMYFSTGKKQDKIPIIENIPNKINKISEKDMNRDNNIGKRQQIVRHKKTKSDGQYIHNGNNSIQSIKIEEKKPDLSEESRVSLNQGARDSGNLSSKQNNIENVRETEDKISENKRDKKKKKENSKNSKNTSSIIMNYKNIYKKPRKDMKKVEKRENIKNMVKIDIEEEKKEEISISRESSFEESFEEYKSSINSESNLSWDSENNPKIPHPKIPLNGIPPLIFRASRTLNQFDDHQILEVDEDTSEGENLRMNYSILQNTSKHLDQLGFLSPRASLLKPNFYSLLRKHPPRALQREIYRPEEGFKRSGNIVRRKGLIGDTIQRQLTLGNIGNITNTNPNQIIIYNRRHGYIYRNYSTGVRYGTEKEELLEDLMRHKATDIGVRKQKAKNIGPTKSKADQALTDLGDGYSIFDLYRKLGSLGDETKKKHNKPRGSHTMTGLFLHSPNPNKHKRTKAPKPI